MGYLLEEEPRWKKNKIFLAPSIFGQKYVKTCDILIDQVSNKKGHKSGMMSTILKYYENSLIPFHRNDRVADKRSCRIRIFFQKQILTGQPQLV